MRGQHQQLQQDGPRQGPSVSSRRQSARGEGTQMGAHLLLQHHQQQQPQTAQLRPLRARSCSACNSSRSSLAVRTTTPPVSVQRVGPASFQAAVAKASVCSPGPSCCSTTRSSGSIASLGADDGRMKLLGRPGEEEDDPERLSQMLQSLWQMLRRHQAAAAEAVSFYG